MSLPRTQDTRLEVDNLVTFSAHDNAYHITLNSEKLGTGRERTDNMIALFRTIMHELQLCGYIAVSASDHMAHALDTSAAWNKIEFAMNDDGSLKGMRLKSELASYMTDGRTEEQAKRLQQADLNSTTGMLNAFSLTMGPLALALVEASQQFDKATGAQHSHQRVGDV